MLFPQVLLAVPLILVFSLVHAATRHEHPKPIFLHAARFAFYVILFMVAIAVVLELLMYFLKG